MEDDYLLPSEKRQKQENLSSSSAEDESYLLPSELRGRKVLPKVGSVESAFRGAGQMAFLGYNPQVVAKAKTLFGGDYEQELQAQKSKQEAAFEQHPYAYGAGATTTFIPSVAAAIAAPEVSGPALAARAAGPGLLARTAGALRPVSSVAELGATGLDALAAGRSATGIAQPALSGVSRVLRNPITQGAIYGTSEGETLEEKAIGAAKGALGAKIGEKLIPIAARAVTAAPKYVANRLFNSIGASPSESQIAADLANKIGISLPKAVGEPTTLSGLSQKLDPLGQINVASAQTVGQIYGKLDEIHNDVLPEEAGAAINSAFKNWLKTEFRTQLDNVYSPNLVKQLSTNPSPFKMQNLASELNAIRSSSKAKLTDVEPTLDIVKKALSHPDGLSFYEMRMLREIVSDEIDFNKLPGSRNLDDEILGKIRDAIKKDMMSAAESISGPDGVAALRVAEQQASELYKFRDFLVNKLSYDPQGFGNNSSLFKNLTKMAKARTGDSNTLNALQSTIDPSTWNRFSQAAVRDLIPEGRFSLSGFNKNWNSFSPKGKDILFGPVGTPIRDQLENISKFGDKVGLKLDRFASRAPEVQDIASGIPVQTALLEASMSGGLPFKTLASMAGMIRAGKTGAQDIAAAMPPPSAMQKMTQFVRTNLESSPEWQEFVTRVADPAFRNTSDGAKILNESAKRFGIMLSAKTGAELTPDQIQALALATSMAAQKAWSGFRGEQQESAGGRIERKSGGRVDNVERLVNVLMSRVNRAKRVNNEITKPLLEQPDEAIVKALSVAQQAI